MPIVQFKLVRGRHSDAAVRELLVDASHAYVDILYPETEPRPIGRARAYVELVEPQHWATAGRLVAEGGADAPYFTCLALAGRPRAQLQSLLSTMTGLIAKHLGTDEAQVRGRVIEVDPELWSIGGQPASEARRAEVEDRARPKR